MIKEHCAIDFDPPSPGSAGVAERNLTHRIASIGSERQTRPAELASARCSLRRRLSARFISQLRIACRTGHQFPGVAAKVEHSPTGGSTVQRAAAAPRAIGAQRPVHVPGANPVEVRPIRLVLSAGANGAECAVTAVAAAICTGQQIFLCARRAAPATGQ